MRTLGEDTKKHSTKIGFTLSAKNGSYLDSPKSDETWIKFRPSILSQSNKTTALVSYTLLLCVHRLQRSLDTVNGSFKFIRHWNLAANSCKTADTG